MADGRRIVRAVEVSTSAYSGKQLRAKRDAQFREPLAKPLVGRVFLPEAEGTDGQRGGTQRS